MGSASIAALLIVLGLGPPILPPLPGEQPAESPASKTSEATSGPSNEVEPSKPTPTAKPETKSPTKASPSSAPPPSAPPPEGTFSIPDSVAPPQPEVAGPPRAIESDAKTQDPPTNSAPAPSPRIGDPLAPTAPPAFIKLPPPTRPPYRGTGLFIAAGVSFSIALTEQIIAHRLIKTRCIDPIARGGFDSGGDVGNVVQRCAPGVLPALALRVHSDLGLLTAIGLATAGGLTRANSDAYAHVFDEPARRKTVAGLRIAGVSLLGAGVVAWLSTGAASWGVVGNCKTAKCVNRGRLMGFITRDVSAGMVASGAGMLAYAEGYRRRHDGYVRDRALSVGPQLGWGQLGLRAHGRF